MKTTLIILLLLCSTALYAQETVISTGSIPIGIKVRDSNTNEFLDIATLCNGFDDEGLPIDFWIPFRSQIILFLPGVTAKNNEHFKQYDGTKRPRSITNINYDYEGEKVAFLGSKSHSGGSYHDLVIINEKQEDLAKRISRLQYQVDWPELEIYELYLVDEIKKMITEASEDPFSDAVRDYDDWFEKNYADSVDKNGLPINPEFPYGTNDLILTMNAYSPVVKVKLFGRKGGEQELIPIAEGERTFSIDNLKPGNYLITIENTQKRYGAKSITYAFSIANSFWRQYGLTFILIIFSLITPFFIYRAITKAKINRLKLNKQLSEAELKAIRAQLNPHFLFNALNAIQNLVNKQDTDNANQYIAKLSKLMRKVLAQSDNAMHTLAEEIEMSTLYLELEKMRTPFTYELQVDSEVSQHMLLPSMILQPYLENAVIHGVLNGNGDHIRLNIFADQDLCMLEVSDNGTGSTKTTGNGKGLKLGKERLDIINRQLDTHVKTSVSTSQLSAGGYRVTIKLPTDL